MPDNTTINREFDAEVRPLIDLIDRLRGFGLDRDINLPAVAVIGDQSAGKSSVLEAISGVQLPRGTGIVTRCPLEIRMKKSRDGAAWHGNISYKIASKDSKDDQIHSVPLQAPEEVEQLVRKAQTDMTGDQVSISDDLISLEVTSPDVPDLTLIDLPGIARVFTEGQEEHLEEKIKDLIRTHIGRQTTIILVVVQSNADIATCEAIRMAKEFDEEGCRTLGVLTKPDLVDPGSEEGIMKIMENEEFPLSKGYIIVKCRGQRALVKKQPLKDSIAEETTFFKNHEQFKFVPSTQRGIENLSVRLTKELKAHIQKLLPELRADVHTKLLNTMEKINSLGMCPSSTTEKRLIAQKMVNHFATVLHRITRGEQIDDGVTPMEVNRLYNEARKSFQGFYDKAQKNTPDASNELKYPPYNLRNKLKQELEKGRGRELCDYVGKFEYVEKYSKQYIKQLQEPAIVCFDSVHDLTMKVYRILVDFCFGRFPSFAAKAKDAIKRKKSETQKRGKDEITRYFSTEANFIFTQDITYMSVLYDEEIEEQEDAITVNMSARDKRRMVEKGLEKDGCSLDSFDWKQSHIDSKHMFASQACAKGNNHLRKLQVVSNTTMHDVDKIMRSLVSYYKVAMRRISDHVPMLVHQHLFREEVKAICDQFSAMAADDEMLKFIAEQEDVAKHREMYEGKQARLQKAMDELEKFESEEQAFEISTVGAGGNFM